MEKQNQLPFFGVGPYMITPIVIIAVLSFVASSYKLIPIYTIPQLDFLFVLVGVISIILGIVLWLAAIVNSRISENIKNKNLVTTGVYAYVRHPIYSCFLFVTTGVIIISQNILLFILPLIFWVFLTVILKKTEEKLLLGEFGEEYTIYSNKVNRLIPFKK